MPVNMNEVPQYENPWQKQKLSIPEQNWGPQPITGGGVSSPGIQTNTTLKGTPTPATQYPTGLKTQTDPAYDPRGTFGTKQWTDWNYTGNYGLTPQNIAEEWYRNASWAPHQIWNPQYGFQDIKDIEKLYAAGGGLSSLTPQMEASFAGSKPAGWAPGGAGSTGGMGMNYGGNIYQNWPYPGEWNTASQVASDFAWGLPTNIPETWKTGSELATQMATTGQPTDLSAWWEAQQPSFERRVSDLSKQATEAAGLRGNLWSSGLQRNITDIVGKESANLWSDFATQQLSADEAAKQRMLSGISQLYGFGQGETGLAESAKDRALSASGLLSNIGSLKAQLPQQVAQGLYSTGMGQTGLLQGDIDRQMQEYLRMAPENSPWLQYVASLAGGMQQPYAAQMYTPGFGTNMMNMFSSMLPYLLNQGGNVPTSAYGYPNYYDATGTAY